MRRGPAYHLLPTELRNPRSAQLDRLSTSALLRLMNREDARVLQAIRRQLSPLARAVDLLVQTLRRGGRVVFAGAGTSGRLGVLEAAECPPTFSTPPSQLQALMAGGRGAVFRSREGAEDDERSARRAIRRIVHRGDVVVGIAASGVTPFVGAALRSARARGARTVLLTCSSRSAIGADVQLMLAVGPELLTGSTRLKAGTATKLALNMLTLGTMVRLGKTFGNLMVDVRPTSRKLRARALGIIRSLTGCSARRAEAALSAAHGGTKTAVVMVAHDCSVPAARRRLARAGGSLRQALHRSATMTGDKGT